MERHLHQLNCCSHVGRRPLGRWFISALILLLTCVSAGAESTSLLGTDGQIFRLSNGSYSELFPEGDELGAAYDVLALEIVDPDLGSQRLLVPGTENLFAEVSASTVYEAASKTLYVLWEGFHNGIHPRIYLTSYTDDGWGELLQIGASPFGRKSSPQLTIVQESYSAENSTLEWTDRTILHLTWWEGLPSGSTKIYSPLLFEDGEFVGPAAIVDLPLLVRGEEEPSFPEVAPGIENALRVQSGHNNRSTVLGFLEPGSGDLVVLDLETLPAALIDLAEKARLQIINLGFKSSHQELADAAAEAILALDTDFHQVTLTWFAEQVRAMIENANDDLTNDGVESMGGKARLQIINLGASFKDHGLQEVPVLHILEVPGSVEGALGHFLKVAQTFRKPAPEVGAEAALFLSDTGEKVIVAWQEEADLHFISSSASDEGWSSPTTLHLGDQLSLEQAYALLENRVHSR